MNKYASFLKKTTLFSGVGDADIVSMLNCLKASFRQYNKGEYVFRQGEYLRNLALLAAGKLYVQREDYWGNLSLLNEIDPGEMFGEAAIAPNSGTLMNDVIAAEASTVLMFDIERLLSVCPSACPFHTRLVKNLFYALSNKNRGLVQKLGLLSQRSTREKLLSYLSDEAKKQGKKNFTIPFNRQQLADFLSVDRSALSNELSKMRKEGILAFHKNEFTVHEREGSSPEGRVYTARQGSSAD